MTSLNNLTQRLEHLCELLDGQEGELPDDLLEQFAEASLDHTKKVDAYIHVLNRLRVDSAYYSKRSETLLRRAKTCEKIEKAMKERLIYAIEAHQDLPWKSSDGDKLRVQSNPPKLACSLRTDKKSIAFIVSPEDAAAIPEFVKRVEYKVLDLEAVKGYLEFEGTELPWAKIEKGTHLRIY